ncbi:MAG: MFS transporter, partial [Chloroflexi bacterium]|nr:MFS transporter [Chloroflexota bacterium]
MPADEPTAGASAGVLTGKKRGSLAAVGRLRTFQALQHRDYRFLWLGQCGYSIAVWGESIARGWLVYDMTGSASALGLVSMLRSIPMLLLGLLAGVVADRFDKRKVLMICQTATMLNLLLLSILLMTGTVQVWHIMVTTFFMGCSLAFIMPARQSLIPFLVGKENTSNAVALSSAAMNVNRIIGPSLAGALIKPIGTGGVYVSITAVYVFIIATTIMMRIPP